MSRFWAVFWAIVAACLAAFIICLMWLPQPADARACMGPEEAKAIQQVMMPDATFSDLGPKETAAFLAIYNALPDPTNLTGDFMVVMDSPRLPGLVIWIFEKGCGAHSLQMPRQQFLAIMQGA